jgi:hypothetical protein
LFDVLSDLSDHRQAHDFDGDDLAGFDDDTAVDGTEGAFAEESFLFVVAVFAIF